MKRCSPRRLSMRMKSIILFCGLCAIIFILFILESSNADASNIFTVEYRRRYFATVTVIVMLMAGYAAWEFRAHHRAETDSQKLEKIANTDMLTEIYNRRYFMRRTNDEIAEALRYGQTIALIMLDIDHFKSINNRFGHLAGDKVLKALAAKIHGQLRSVDLLARWGGEEFIILMPHCNISDAAHLAEKLRKTVSEKPFDDVGDVHISLGAAQYRQGEEFDQWLQRADRALYRAKSEGRNTVRAIN